MRSPGVPGEDCNSALVDCSRPGPDLHPQGGMTAQELTIGRTTVRATCILVSDATPRRVTPCSRWCSWCRHVLGLGAGHGMEVLPVAQSPLRKGETISQLSRGCPKVKCLSTDPRCPDSRAQVLLITLLKSVTGHNTGAQRRPTRSPCPLQSRSKARPPGISELHIPWLFGWSLKIGPHSTVLLKLQKNN